MAKLQDTLLKQTHHHDTVDPEEMKARLEETTRARGEHMALTELLRSQAWPVLRQKLVDDEWDIMKKMEMSTDPTTLSKLVGSLLACKAQQVWPERRLAELTEFLTAE